MSNQIIGGIVMGKNKKAKFYAVKEGFKCNVIVMSWAECQKLTDHYPNARYHSFYTQAEAEDYLSGKQVPQKEVAQAVPKTARRVKKKGFRLEVLLSDPKIYEDMKKECERLDLSVDKAIEGLISEWIY